MSLQVHEIGEEKNRVIVIDGLVEDPALVVEQAAALVPYPDVTANFYPGLRRMITPADKDAYGYVDLVCSGIAPLMRQVFGVARFSIDSASFSMVTQPATALALPQRVPHYDTLDQNYFAILHFLSPVAKGGTGFYRHRATGFERMTASRNPVLGRALDTDLGRYGEPHGYVAGSTEIFEQTAAFDGVFNRVLIYQGALLHSGLIPDDFDFDPDPRKGRLTANIFLQGS